MIHNTEFSRRSSNDYQIADLKARIATARSEHEATELLQKLEMIVEDQVAKERRGQ